MVLNKKQFCEVLNIIEENNKKIEDIRKINSDLSLGIVGFLTTDTVIFLLEKMFDLEVSDKCGSVISWWVYATNFGKDNPIITEKHKSLETVYELNTAEKLFDYLTKEKIK